MYNLRRKRVPGGVIELSPMFKEIKKLRNVKKEVMTFGHIMLPLEPLKSKIYGSFNFTYCVILCVHTWSGS